jgi:4-hydroxy-4-methyl-2-oxoglutarate aldolase
VNGNSELQTRLDRVTVAAVSDALDALGLRCQVMHQRLRPLDPSHCRFAGRARTLRWMECDYIVEDDPYGLELDAMDALRPGDVVVHSTDTGESNAPWGELMTTAALARGAVGCVCDSQIRDCSQIQAMQFPVFYRGIRAVDSKGRGRVMAYDVPVKCGDVLVQPRELVLADFDGVVVIPTAAEDAVVDLAFEKISKENLSRGARYCATCLRVMACSDGCTGPAHSRVTCVRCKPLDLRGHPLRRGR